VPAADCSIMLRPTKSLALYLQQCGRVLRAVPGKPPAILLDHAGNIARHGLPDDDWTWTLAGKTKAEAGEPIKQCPACFRVMKIHVARCPECGRSMKGAGEGAREVDYVDGELQEMDIVAARQAKGQEQARARSIDDLIRIGTERGYKHPGKWAAHIYTARLQKRGAA
jgi:superfamily II DNA or RNA helicase